MCYEDNTKKLQHKQKPTIPSQVSKLTHQILKLPKYPPTLFWSITVKPLCQAVVFWGENSTSVGGRSVPVLTLESYPPEAIKVGDLLGVPFTVGTGVPLKIVL